MGDQGNMPKIPWKGVAAIVFSGLLVYVGITDLTLLFDQANRRHEVVRWWTEAEAWVLIVGMGLWWLTLRDGGGLPLSWPCRGYS